jgi:hypothetical protein
MQASQAQQPGLRDGELVLVRRASFTHHDPADAVTGRLNGRQLPPGAYVA